MHFQRCIQLRCFFVFKCVIIVQSFEMTDDFWINCFCLFIYMLIIMYLKRIGQKFLHFRHDCFKIIYRIARDPRFKRLPCLHKGTYADDCIVQRITQVNTHNHIVSEFWITLWINFELFEYLVGINWYDFTCTLFSYSTNVTLLPLVIKIWGEESERSQGYPSCTCNNTGKFNILYFLI